jgi:hypothetical protein
MSNVGNTIGYVLIAILCCPFIAVKATGKAISQTKQEIYEYFHPDFATAVTQHYRRPVLHLKLCKRCRKLKNSSGRHLIRHHPDLKSLSLSAASGCWVCQRVWKEYGELIEEHENPRVPDFGSIPEDFKFTQLNSLRFLLWFRKEVSIETGYLDNVDGKSECVLYPDILRKN